MAVCRMSENYNNHIPVLLNESVDNLVTTPDGIYIDATFGRGSHSRAILNKLSQQGRLIAFDKDPEAIQYAKQHIQDNRFAIYHTAFSRMQLVLNELQLMGKIQGILFDLGVSSPQLDNPDRGFSFVRKGKLDMRMDTSQGIDAVQWLAEVDEQELVNVLWQYGEEKFSRRIAKAIVEARAIQPISTTAELVDIIKAATPKATHYLDKHPATRSFQAIRIAVNQELTELELALLQAYQALAINGRMAIISFHSLEDRMVKQFIRQHEKGKQDIPHNLPIKGVRFQSTLKAVGKAIKPTEHEIDLNPRSRSAILRIAEKLS